MMSAKEARKIASKLRVPTPGSGEFIRVPGLEVLHFFLLINSLEVAGWRGNYLQVRPARHADDGSVQEAGQVMEMTA